MVLRERKKQQPAPLSLAGTKARDITIYCRIKQSLRQNEQLGNGLSGKPPQDAAGPAWVAGLFIHIPEAVRHLNREK